MTLKKNWQLPDSKVEGYVPVAFIYKNGITELDFYKSEKCDYLSEYEELFVKIQHPFSDGYKPTKRDWELLGFLTHFE